MIEKDFILILGHGRSGTTLCASLLNMVPGINIGLEINNNSIGVNGIEFPKNLTGNKVVPHVYISNEYLVKAFIERKWIISKEYKDLKVIFTQRDSIEIILSQYKRLVNKLGNLTLRQLVKDFIIVENKLQMLKKFFKNYHIFDFDKAVKDVEERISLFRFCGLVYKKEYSDNYIGAKPYLYTSVHPKNILFGIKKNFPELSKEIYRTLEKERNRV